MTGSIEKFLTYNAPKPTGKSDSGRRKGKDVTQEYIIAELKYKQKIKESKFYLNEDSEMQLKRKYDRSSGEPKCIGVFVDAARLSAKQNFSSNIIGVGEDENWLKASDKEITIKCLHGKDYVYDVDRAPAKHCNECSHTTDLTLDQTGEQIRLHIALKHAGKGTYDVVNAYECTLRGEG